MFLGLKGDIIIIERASSRARTTIAWPGKNGGETYAMYLY